MILFFYILLFYLSNGTQCNLQKLSKSIFKRQQQNEDFSLLPLYRKIKLFMNENLDPSKSKIAWDFYRQNNRLQPYLTMNFPCNLTNTRSTKPPVSVNKLRPGDIDVIAAMGDSLTAGYGILSTSTTLGITVEYRGLTFSAGGEKNWREVLTLPNILKVFNPKLIGQSLATSLTTERASQFNVADGTARSEDMPYMAKVLIKRMQADPRVDMHDHWKMITLLIGPNDMCNMCYGNIGDILKNHRRNLITTFRILKANLPRTLINFILTPDVQNLKKLSNKPETCRILNIIECSCVFGPKSYNREFEIKTGIRAWQKIDEEVAFLEEFNTENFTILLQPFFADITLPRTKTGRIDIDLLSDDCFHLSQRGHYLVANSLWNNIMEPLEEKTKYMVDFKEKFTCPTSERPYIATRGNKLQIIQHNNDKYK